MGPIQGIYKGYSVIPIRNPATIHNINCSSCVSVQMFKGLIAEVPGSYSGGSGYLLLAPQL